MTTAMTAGWVRTRVELLQYFREKESVFFSFSFPILMLVLFSTIFAAQFDGDPGLSAARFFLPGMLSAGVLLTSFQTMAMSVAVERDDGTLKRLQGQHAGRRLGAAPPCRRCRISWARSASS